MALYHKDVFFPDKIVNTCPQLYKGNITYSKHVNERFQSTSHGEYVDEEKVQAIIKDIKQKKPKPFEIETDMYGNAVKCVIRHSYDNDRDICLVFRENRLITIWFNFIDDRHITLDKSKYARC